MNSKLLEWHYQETLVETLTDEKQETWFVAKDVCDILDLPNVTNTVKKLDEDEKLTLKVLRSGQQRETWIINESGLYHLILTSTKPEAKKFRKWVTGELLPSIRRAGLYTTEQAQHKELELQRLTNEIENIEIRISDYKSQIKTWNTEREEKLKELRQVIKSNPNQLSLELDD